MSIPLTDEPSSIVDLITARPTVNDSASTGPPPPNAVQEKSGQAAADLNGTWGVERLFPWEEIHALPTRQLRLLCNKTFKAMDTDLPPAEAFDQYAALIEEIKEREKAEENSSEGGKRYRREERVAFRDNAIAQRYELFVDGDVAGYVKYQMHGGQVVLLETVITTEFSFPESGIEETLLRRTFLNAHQRRLAMRTRCSRAHTFLTEYPQYRSLVPATAQRAVTRINRAASWNT